MLSVGRGWLDAGGQGRYELRTALKVAVLAVLFCVAYWPALSAGFVWDDFAYVVDNDALQGLDGLVRIWASPDSSTQYYPLVFTSFWLERQLWGTTALGYHLVNVLLHAVTVALLALLLARWGLRCAWLAAVLFAVHPVQVQSVVWVAERKNVLSGVFFVMALLAWQSYSATRRRRDYFLCLGASVLALLGKAALVPLPLVLLLVSWWRSGRTGRDEAAVVAPVVAVAVAIGAHHAWLEASNVASHSVMPDLASRVVVAGRSLWFYLGTLLWPVNLVPIFPKWQVNASVLAEWLWPLSAVSVPVVLYAARGRIGRGPCTAAVYFGLMLAPALGFVQQGINRFTDVALHFEYLAILGPIVLTAEIVGAVALRGRMARMGVWSVAAVALGALAALSHHHATHYRDVESLFTYNVQATPTSWGPHYHLARRAAWEGRLEESVGHYRRALELAPWSVDAASELADLYVASGRPQLALETLQASLRSGGPQALIFNQLAAVLDQVGRPAEARVALENALALAPDNSQYRANLGKVCLDLEDFACAEAKLRTRLGEVPSDAVATTLLADVLRRTQRSAEALELYRASLAIVPQQPPALYGVAESLAELGRLEESREAFTELSRVSPGVPLIWRRLGEVLNQLSRFREAEEALCEALRLKPDYTDALLSLANVAERQGDLAKATSTLRRALAGAPGSRQAHLELARVLGKTGNAAEANEHLERARTLQSGSSGGASPSVRRPT